MSTLKHASRWKRRHLSYWVSRFLYGKALKEKGAKLVPGHMPKDVMYGMFYGIVECCGLPRITMLVLYTIVNKVGGKFRGKAGNSTGTGKPKP